MVIEMTVAFPLLREGGLTPFALNLEKLVAALTKRVQLTPAR